jgi:hypothetical protein
LSTHFISLKCTRPETVGYDLTTFIRILSCSDLLNAASVYWHIWDAVDWLLSKPRTLKKRLIKGRNELARMKSLQCPHFMLFEDTYLLLTEVSAEGPVACKDSSLPGSESRFLGCHYHGGAKDLCFLTALTWKGHIAFA